jgi:signal transduction histidine kinase
MAERKTPPPPGPVRRPSFNIWRALPRTFQGRLSLAFVLVFAIAVGIVSVLTIFVLDTDLRNQQESNLAARAKAVAAVVQIRAEASAAANAANTTVVDAGDQLNPDVRAIFTTPETLTKYANQVALADVKLTFGLGSGGVSGTVFVPAADPSTFSAKLTDAPGRGQARDDISYSETFRFDDPNDIKPSWYLQVSLSDPYTTRGSTITAVVGFLTLTSLGALMLAIVVASFLARRFTKPLRRLTEAAQALAEGDLDRRVAADRARTGGAEIAELSRQFNAMAEQVQESMEVIRRDRDASREFLADVSHELRTPLAALRTFNELLLEKAGNDVAARTEFLEASAQQIARLDWLAQNLLELSKLDSGLVRLDLRPDDLRTTILSAVEQAQLAAHRRGVSLTTQMPDAPLVIRHDPQRFGQVVNNLVGNALKFTPKGGSVLVSLAPQNRGARLQVTDTGVGIDAHELPHIFDRFYRGSRANEARGSGSGLGLAIVRSVVEMHGGRVMVESRVGTGSTFTVTLPADPRTAVSAAAGAAGGATAGVVAGTATAGSAAGASAPDGA